MTYIFDGKEFAAKKEVKLKNKVSELAKLGIVPKLVSIIVGDNPASVLYVNLKKKAAERLGCKLLIVKSKADTSKVRLIEKINKYNKDNTVHGIMIQLPLPVLFSQADRDEIINSISLKKDVDGLCLNSKFTPPTAKAVWEIYKNTNAYRKMKTQNNKIVVVGASGFIGKQLVRRINKGRKFRVLEVDSSTKNLNLKVRDSDVIISVTGVSGLIKKNMVKTGAILIDVGSPKGDVDKKAYTRASFVSPVPGGVGPVTISCLLENLISSAYK